MPFDVASKSGTVLIASHHTTFGEALVNCLNTQFSIRSMLARTEQEMMQACESEQEIKLVLMDHGQALSIDPIVQELARKLPVALLLDRPSASVARAVIEGDFRGMLLKYTPLNRAIAAIRLMLGGDQYLSDLLPKTAVHLDPFVREMKLSRRESSVVELIARGQSNKIIEETLNLSAAGVSSIVHKLFVKFDVRNRTELAIQWENSGNAWSCELRRA
jgi:DNA-binding NarL/FixJ family response regulator